MKTDVTWWDYDSLCKDSSDLMMATHLLTFHMAHQPHLPDAPGIDNKHFCLKHPLSPENTPVLHPAGFPSNRPTLFSKKHHRLWGPWQESWPPPWKPAPLFSDNQASLCTWRSSSRVPRWRTVPQITASFSELAGVDLKLTVYRRWHQLNSVRIGLLWCWAFCAPLTPVTHTHTHTHKHAHTQ